MMGEIVATNYIKGCIKVSKNTGIANWPKAR